MTPTQMALTKLHYLEDDNPSCIGMKIVEMIPIECGTLYLKEIDDETIVHGCDGEGCEDLATCVAQVIRTEVNEQGRFEHYSSFVCDYHADIIVCEAESGELIGSTIH